MKNITKSLAVIAAVAAIVVGGSIAYFSDSDVSGNNAFTAGTLEIDIDGINGVWEDGFTLDDMKPCYTDYINFRINNTGNNPVDITKKLVFDNGCERENGINEPECEAYDGNWSNGQCTGGNHVNNIEDVINYDLYVEVYDASGNKIWWQTIYVDGDNMTIGALYGAGGLVYLGMIPEGGHMLVIQSYHMVETAGNEYQSDRLTFNITIEGKQITGTVVLEDKDYASDTWKIDTASAEKGTLTYKVKNPTFDFTFTGKAPLTDTDYVLAAGYDAGTNPDTFLGTAKSDGTGNITITGDLDLGKDMKDVKVWLVPDARWNGGGSYNWIPWPGCVSEFLWETGLIWYEDTDL